MLRKQIKEMHDNLADNETYNFNYILTREEIKDRQGTDVVAQT